jgi:hypothetical protein
MTILEQVISDFMRMETDGPAELQVRQSGLAEIKNGFDADPKKSSNLFRRPKCIASRGFRMVHGQS